MGQCCPGSGRARLAPWTHVPTPRPRALPGSGRPRPGGSGPAGAEAAWKQVRLPKLDESTFYGGDCPAPALCVLVGSAADPPEGRGSAGVIAGSRTPQAGARAWKPSDWRVMRFDERGQYVPNFRDVSCPTPRFCVAVANKGRIFTSSRPLAGPGAWRETVIPDLGSLRFVSCPSRRFCAILGYRGVVLTSTSPAAGPGAWQRTDIEELGGPSNPFGEPAGIDCPTEGFCAAADGYTVYYTADPMAGRWVVGHVTEPAGPGMSAFVCRYVGLCLAGSGDGGILVFSSPTDPAADPVELPAGEESVHAISCPTASRCAASISPGEIYFSDDAADGPWLRSRRFLARDAGFRAFACPLPEFCVAGGNNGLLAVSY